MGGRNARIDMLKGILIFLVVWAHAIQYSFGYEYGENFECFNDGIHRIICSFHMPLFMAISGYLFYYSNKKPAIVIVKSKLQNIGIPYLTFCTISLLLFNMSAIRDLDWMNILGSYKNGFWFLTSYLLNSLIVLTVTRVVNNRNCQYLLFSVIGISALFIPGEYLYNTHAYVYPAFVVGYIVNELEIKIRIKKWMTIPAMILLCGSAFYFSRDLYVYTTGISINQDYKQLWIDIIRWGIALVNSVCYIVVVYSFEFNGWLSDALARFSKCSIGIYCLSMIIQLVVYKLMHYVNIAIVHNYILSVVMAIITIVVCERMLWVSSKVKILNVLLLGGRGMFGKQ